MDIFCLFQQLFAKILNITVFVCTRTLYLTFSIKIHLPKGMILLGAVKQFKFRLRIACFKKYNIYVSLYATRNTQVPRGNARILIPEGTLISRNHVRAPGTFIQKAAAFRERTRHFIEAVVAEI